jgi:hypothetical protein
MWLDIVFWIVLITTAVWVLKKSGLLLMLLEVASRRTYVRLSPEEKAKFDTIVEEESLKDVDGERD